MSNEINSGSELKFRLNREGVRLHFRDQDGALTGKTEEVSAGQIMYCKEGEDGFVSFDSDRPQWDGHVEYLRSLTRETAVAAPCSCEIFENCPACTAPDELAKIQARREEVLAYRGTAYHIAGTGGDDAGQVDGLGEGEPDELTQTLEGLAPGQQFTLGGGSKVRLIREPEMFPGVPGSRRRTYRGPALQAPRSPMAEALEAGRAGPRPPVPLPVLDGLQPAERAYRAAEDDRAGFQAEGRTCRPLTDPVVVDFLGHSVEEGFASQITRTVRNRGTDYGRPQDNHQLTADLWSAWLSRRLQLPVKLTPEDVCMLNVLQKSSRLAFGTKDDSWLDIAGYTENVAMIRPDQRNKRQ